MRHNKHKQKGFTLIELLIVIAIIAILAVVVVLTLNPAELLRQARDSNRISDFATIKSALALYGVDVATTTSMDGGALTENLYSANSSTLTQTSALTVLQGTATGTWGFTHATTIVSAITSKSVGGTGWIPVNLNAISSGAPISSWPVDPVNTATNTAYVYDANLTSWKIATMMESAKYITNGPNDVETGDGGQSIYAYEQGSNMGL
jgi:prepilin-type N-terminal cleavage/methylation domain-containing protein